MILLGIDLSQVEARVELLLAAATPEFEGTDVAKECIKLATARYQIPRHSTRERLDYAARMAIRLASL